MKLIWSPLAIERSAELVEYIALDNPSAANKWLDEVFAKVQMLGANPEMGRMVLELNRKEIREIVLRNYRIVYRIEKSHIAILTIRHTKQILPLDDFSL